MCRRSLRFEGEINPHHAPEGYLLEFERFLDDDQNRLLLNALARLPVDDAL